MHSTSCHIQNLWGCTRRRAQSPRQKVQPSKWFGSHLAYELTLSSQVGRKYVLRCQTLVITGVHNQTK